MKEPNKKMNRLKDRMDSNLILLSINKKNKILLKNRDRINKTKYLINNLTNKPGNFKINNKIETNCLDQKFKLLCKNLPFNNKHLRERTIQLMMTINLVNFHSKIAQSTKM